MGIAFFNGAILWGLFTAAAPIIIHLLFRQRYRRTLWAAMEFLLAAIKRTRRRMRIEQLLLLLIRILILVLLVMVLSRPYQSSAGEKGTSSGGEKYAIVVLDTSMSLEIESNEPNSAGKPIFKKAQDLALAYLDTLAPNKDVAGLILCTENANIDIKGTSNLDEIKKRIMDVNVSDGGSNIMKSIDAALEILKDVKKPNKEIFVISDFHEFAFEVNGNAKANMSEIVRKYEDMKNKGGVDITFVDIGLKEADGKKRKKIPNLRITQVFRAGTLVGKDIPAQFYIRTLNDGDKDITVDMKMLMDNQELTESNILKKLVPERDVNEPITVPANNFWENSIERTFPKEGSRIIRIEAKTKDEMLKSDDSRYLAIAVKDGLNILLVDGDPQRGFKGELDRLHAALRPPVDEDEREDIITKVSIMKPEKISEGELFDRDNLDLNKYDIVVLGNVKLGRFTEKHMRQLEYYVNSGGSLLIFLGNRIENVDRVNANMYKEGHGLLPGKLLKIAGKPKKEVTRQEEAYHIGKQLVSHPAFRIFGEGVEASFKDSLIYQYFQAQQHKGKSYNIKDIPEIENQLALLKKKSQLSESERNQNTRLPKLLGFLNKLKEKGILEERQRQSAAQGKTLSKDDERKLKELVFDINEMEKNRTTLRMMQDKISRLGGLSSNEMDERKKLLESVIFLEEDTSTEVVSSFAENNDPLIMTRDFGRGKVMMWTTNIDQTWNNIAGQTTFLPLMHEMVTYLAREYRGKRNYEVGSMFEIVLQERPRSASLAIPNKEGEFNIHEELIIKDDGNIYRVTHNRPLDNKGPYSLLINWGGGREDRYWFAVNSPLEESSLTYYDEQALANFFKINNATKIPYLYKLNPSITEITVNKTRRGEDLAMTILFILLAMVLFESLLAWYFWWRRARTQV